MAVDASSGHFNLFALHHFRELMNPMNVIGDTYNTQMGCGGLPLSGTTTTDSLPLMHGSLMSGALPPKTMMKSSDSGVTYNVPSLSRKRGRADSISVHDPVLSYAAPHNDAKSGSRFSFMGQDISLQIQQQQLEIDRLVSEHMEKVRLEIEEKRRREARTIVGRIEEEMVKRLKAKEEEIERIGKLNWALEERVKSLCVENQIWRDLAQANEATANALRSNLEQVLAAATQVKDEGHRPRDGAFLQDDEDEDEEAAPHYAADAADDAASCCGSNDNGDYGGVGAGEGQEVAWRSLGGEAEEGSKEDKARCRKCRREEASVLLLPCRHLCLCTACGSSMHTCPLCNSPKSCSVHVNLS